MELREIHCLPISDSSALGGGEESSGYSKEDRNEAEGLEGGKARYARSGYSPNEPIRFAGDKEGDVR